MSDETMHWYGLHGPFTDPGPHGPAIEPLPRDIAALSIVVQGLLLHGSWLRVYGLTTADIPSVSRETLPVAERLAAALGIGPLGEPAPHCRRAVGTCRDFAVMLTALLRHKGTPARVRCGFARYFRSSPCEDHWVCEYLHPLRRQWALADAQLDGAQCAELSIGFDPCDLPREQFLTAGEAWQQVRTGASDAASFGHGSARGEWFMRVNLARDLLALAKQEVSDWDGWRSASSESHPLDGAALAWCDAAADAAAEVDNDLGMVRAPAEPLRSGLRPFWLA